MGGAGAAVGAARGGALWEGGSGISGRGSCGTSPTSRYWRGTPEEYDKLYDYTADAIKRALPAAHVGGPGTTGAGGPKAAHFLKQFLEHCARGENAVTGKRGAPLDFISYHAKGSPRVVDGHVQHGPATRS